MKLKLLAAPIRLQIFPIFYLLLTFQHGKKKKKKKIHSAGNSSWVGSLEGLLGVTSQLLLIVSCLKYRMPEFWVGGGVHMLESPPVAVTGG